MMLSRFIKKVVYLFIIPVVILCILLEFLIRRIPNDYYYKNKWLSENSGNLQILSLGASNGYFGINPEFFSKKAFNAAHISQSINYDLFIFKKFLPGFDSLKYVLLPVTESTFTSSLETSDEFWRIKNYTIYYGCEYHLYEPQFHLAFYGNNLYSVLSRISGYYLLGTSELYCNKLGFGLNYSFAKKSKDWEKSGILAARRHKKESSVKLYDENLSYLNQFIEECYKRNIQVVLLVTPAWHSYLENIDIKQLESTLATFEHLAEQNSNVRFIDLHEDKRFEENDFFDADHLDEFGAKKLTLILNDTLKTLRNGNQGQP
jgi:hypothetical protein